MGSQKKSSPALPEVLLTTCESNPDSNVPEVDDDISPEATTEEVLAAPYKPEISNCEGDTNAFGLRTDVLEDEKNWRRSVSLTLPLKALRGALHQMDYFRHPSAASLIHQDAASTPSIGHQALDFKLSSDAPIFREILILSIIQMVCGLALVVSEASSFFRPDQPWVMWYRQFGCGAGVLLLAAGTLGVVTGRRRSSKLLSVVKGVALTTLILSVSLVYAALGGVDIVLSNGGITHGVFSWANLTFNIIKLILSGVVLVTSFIVIFI